MNRMTAVVVDQPGPPSVLQYRQVPVPQPTPDEVLIRVRAFGLNRSELFTRQGHSPSVKFPRILGIEATGTVESAPGGQFQPGQVVVTAMGGMGRNFDGGADGGSVSETAGPHCLGHTYMEANQATGKVVVLVD